MSNVVRFVLGAAAMIGATTTQRFWELVDRGMAVAPTDRGLAGTIDRSVRVTLPTLVGAALGSGLDGALQGADGARRAFATAGEQVGLAVLSGFRRAGVPTRADLIEIARRLDEAAAALDRLAQDPDA